MSDQPLSERLTAAKLEYRDHLSGSVCYQPHCPMLRTYIAALENIAAEVARLEAERDALRAAVDRVRALHAEQKRRDGYDMSYSSCSADRQDWPCPTIRALDTTEAGDG